MMYKLRVTPIIPCSRLDHMLSSHVRTCGNHSPRSKDKLVHLSGPWIKAVYLISEHVRLVSGSGMICIEQHLNWDLIYLN